MALTAEVAISGAGMTYDKLYTYLVPADMAGHIFVGSMVLVPFGRGVARPRTGVVISLQTPDATPKNVKNIVAVAPEDARLTEELLKIVAYLKEYTFCTWYDAVRTVIPYGAQYKAIFNDTEGWQLQKSIQRHSESVFYKNTIAPETNPTAKGQAVLAYLGNATKTRAQIMQACGVGRGVVDTLIKQGWLLTHEVDKQIDIIGAATAHDCDTHKQALPATQTACIPALSAPQREVAAPLLAAIHSDRQNKKEPALLYGVTGSGKTAVFLNLVDAALKSGKTALVLVPEIGLTPQMVTALVKAFGTQVAVQHSALSNTERLLQWRMIQCGQAPVVVGTRSAIFAPLENIGIIIVDEEQERTYQSESSPRYNAVEVARLRAHYHNAQLLLASATPAITDYYAAKQGRYQLLRLQQRYNNVPLPTVEIVDMRNELGNTGAISGPLTQAIRDNIADGWQTILLLNRRGYNRVGVCRDCGQAIKCGDISAANIDSSQGSAVKSNGCSVPMVYHKKGNRLMCHYCGATVSPPPNLCPACGGEIRYTGFGTQRLEEELAQKFPSAKVLRMDLDSTAKKGAHAAMLRAFGKGEYDIMLGTQMVAKGLDFERVKLVGVIGIDALLFSQGYQAYENVFSLVTQVVGRSGRAGMSGTAIIQTNDPENPVLNLAAAQDYEAFYEQEIRFRKLAMYPPFCDICSISFSAEEEALVLRAANNFSASFQSNARQHPEIPIRLLGPAPMTVAQIAGKFRYRLIIKCRKNKNFRKLVMHTLEDYNKQGWMRSVPLAIDFHSDGSL